MLQAFEEEGEAYGQALSSSVCLLSYKNVLESERERFMKRNEKKLGYFAKVKGIS